MQPTIKKDPPMSTKPFIAVTKTEQTNNTGNFVDEKYIYDRHILIQGGGNDVTVEVIKEEDPCDEKEIAEVLINPPERQTETPCPPGMSWNPVTQQCAEPVLDAESPPVPTEEGGGDDSGDSSDDTILTTNPEEEITIVVSSAQSSQPMLEAAKAQTVAVATSEQQQTYFRRRGVGDGSPGGGGSNGY